MTSALRISFEVACPAARAFAVWTSRIGTWWPPDHTVTGATVTGATVTGAAVTGAAGLTVVLEGRVGGRIFERAADGTEHDWGAVTRWQPPEVLGYMWHLGRDAGDATDVLVRFIPQDAAVTRIEIEHSGWERLGETAMMWRDRNRIGWQTLLPHFAAAAKSDARESAREDA